MDNKQTLNSRLVEIQQTLKAPKNQRNSFANFNYRSCEDILEAVKPLLKGLSLIFHSPIFHLRLPELLFINLPFLFKNLYFIFLYLS